MTQRFPIFFCIIFLITAFISAVSGKSQSGCPYEHKWKKAEEREREKTVKKTPDLSSIECDLEGIWGNERGMQLRISPGVRKNQLVGTISVSSSDIFGTYSIYGSYLKESCMISFTAAWDNDLSGNSKTISSWTGQMMDGVLRMAHQTVSHTPPKFLAWLQYVNGMDVFVRQVKNSGKKDQ